MGALGSADYCGGPDHFALASHKMMSVRVRSDEPTNPVCSVYVVCVCVCCEDVTKRASSVSCSLRGL